MYGLRVLLVSTLVLASKSIIICSSEVINRPDPLRRFKYYHGDYDLSNIHYWASTAFTGVHGYVIAGIWLLLGVLFILSALPKRRIIPLDCYDRCYVSSSLLLILFTILAITTTALVFVGNQQLLNKTKKLAKTIVRTGEVTRDMIENVLNALIGIERLILPYEPEKSAKLNRTISRLGKESKAIHDFVTFSGHTINDAIHSSYVAHLVVVTANLVSVVASIVLLLLHWHPGLIGIIFLCWTLTTMSWILTGVDFVIFSFAGDTCSAIMEYEENPKNSSLSSVLPCLDSSSSTKLLGDVGSSVSNSINQMNSKILDELWSIGFDASESDVLKFGKICIPFTGEPNFTYVPDRCSQSYFKIEDLPEIVSSLTCYNHDNSCHTEGRFISETASSELSAYIGSVVKIMEVYPDFVSLAKCSVVKIAFSEILPIQCQSFRISVKALWCFMVFLCISMMILELIWIGYRPTQQPTSAGA